MIDARALSKRYGRHRVLDDASLAIAPGQTVILTGSNGSGKTTLLHVMMGLRRTDTGRVYWQQRPLTTARIWRAARRVWGFVPQQVHLPPRARVRQLLAFHARLRHTPTTAAEHWLERVGLAEVAGQDVGALSGGMRQRLAIALTLFHDPQLIVMDEPDNSLDPHWRRALSGWLEQASARGAAVLVTSQVNGLCPAGARRVHCESGRLIDGASADASTDGGPA